MVINACKIYPCIVHVVICVRMRLLCMPPYVYGNVSDHTPPLHLNHLTLQTYSSFFITRKHEYILYTLSFIYALRSNFLRTLIAVSTCICSVNHCTHTQSLIYVLNSNNIAHHHSTRFVWVYIATSLHRHILHTPPLMYVYFHSVYLTRTYSARACSA